MVPPVDIPGDKPRYIADERFDEMMDRLKDIEDRYSSGIGGLEDRLNNLPHTR